MQNCQVRTLKAQGHVSNPAALSRLEQVLDQLKELHDACLYQHRLAEKITSPTGLTSTPSRRSSPCCGPKARNKTTSCGDSRTT